MAGFPTEPRPEASLAEHVADGRSLRGTTLVLATHNAGKLAEFRAMFEPYGVVIESAGELNLPEPEETGTTFEDNAALKAASAMETAGKPVLADDSGLCVEALDGAPGVYTADWATGADGKRDFPTAMRKVEDALRERGATEARQRRAAFVAVLCLAWPDGTGEHFRGETRGTLVWPPRGEEGHGYDPVFVPEGETRTFGEMGADEKATLSHRGRAFRAFAERRLR